MNDCYTQQQRIQEEKKFFCSETGRNGNGIQILNAQGLENIILENAGSLQLKRWDVYAFNFFFVRNSLKKS